MASFHEGPRLGGQPSDVRVLDADRCPDEQSGVLRQFVEMGFGDVEMPGLQPPLVPADAEQPRLGDPDGGQGVAAPSQMPLDEAVQLARAQPKRRLLRELERFGTDEMRLFPEPEYVSSTLRRRARFER